MRRQFVTMDVFTTRKGAGNPLAVVLDSADLTDAQMQLIAREFNLSETTFVLAPRAGSDCLHANLHPGSRVAVCRASGDRHRGRPCGAA